MCDPGTIAGLVLTAAGTAMQMAAQKKAQNAIKAARVTEMQRQEEMRRRGADALDKTIGEFNPEAAAADLSSQEADLSGAYAAAAAPMAESGLPAGGSAGAPKIVGDSQTAALTRAKNAISGAAVSRAKVNAPGRMLWDKGFKINDAGQEINLVNNERRGSLDVLGIEIDAAARKAQSPIGDLLVGLGGSVASSGFGGGGGLGYNTVSSYSPSGIPLPPRKPMTWGPR